jgi:hypothetical protein
MFSICSKLGPVEKPGTTIKIYKRLNGSGEIIGWCADIKIPGIGMWTEVRRDEPRDYWGSIYPTKEAAIEGAKREIIRRGGGPKTSRKLGHTSRSG